MPFPVTGGYSNRTSFNDTFGSLDNVKRTDNTALIVILCVFILLIIAVVLVFHVMRRSQSW